MSVLRHLPAPASEPPYDDEHAGRGPAGPTLGRRAGHPGPGVRPPNGHPRGPGPDLRPPAGPEARGRGRRRRRRLRPQPTPTAALPHRRAWSARFAQAVVEVLAGDRPVSQLVRWTTTSVYDDLAALVVGPAAVRGAAARGVVRSIHVSEPVDGVAEVAALVRRGARSTAVALRLEGLDGRWQCTALELG